MAEAASTSTTTATRKTYCSKTIEYKRSILLEIEKGTTSTAIANRENLPKSTISTWLKNKEKILADLGDDVRGQITDFVVM
jgi:DNA-binding NarL/FixJ family response regulator